MRGALAARWWGAVCAGVALLLASPSGAIEFFDGRLNVSGFYEAQIRGLANDFSGADGYDLAAWDNVLNIEAEAEIAPYGWGPFNMVTGFARVEVRYNCVYNHACGMFQSANAYGNDAQRLPKRLLNGRRAGTTGTLFTNDDGSREYRRVQLRGPDATEEAKRFIDSDGDGVFDTPLNDLQQLGVVTDNGMLGDTLNASSRRPLRFTEIPPFTAFAGIPGPDQINNTFDDPFPAVADKFENCRFGVERTKGPNNGVGNDVLPHSFDCDIDSTASIGDIPNPFRGAADYDGDGVVEPGDFNPRLGTPGGGEQPLRPAPIQAAGMGTLNQAQGIWYPNPGLRGRFEDFDEFDQNFTEEEMQWNRGGAQQDEKELRELYLDVEMFNSRLWLRLGKQNIVWGKTELFRTTDQFNPQDVALASLPSLEESRIPLWAARGVWSFYEVGPFQDVRLEVAANIDQFEPIDIGRCGEPFVPRLACDKTFGLMAHGLVGNGLAGEERPANPWDDLQGLEVGARLEWRWDRFSFALMDFYGYNDTPYLERLYTYERRVDPSSGRPLRTGFQDGCETGNEEACLLDPDFDETDPASVRAQRERSLLNHTANQQSFAAICSTSIGFTSLDPTVCAQTVFNSTNLVPGTPFALNEIVGRIVPGTPTSTTFDSDSFFQLLTGFLAGHLGGLTPPGGMVVDARSMANGGDGVARPTPLVELEGSGETIEDFLSTEQQALVGCGEFYGTSCLDDGIDLLNAEASALMQSFPGIEGTRRALLEAREATGNPDLHFTTTNNDIQQPGTVGFPGNEVACARAGPNGPERLPGCASLPRDWEPGDGLPPGFPTGESGNPIGLVQPFTNQQFANEMGALSWNALMTLTAFSASAPYNDLNDNGALEGTFGCTPGPGCERSLDNLNPQADRDLDGILDVDTFDPRDPDDLPGFSEDEVGPFRLNGCSYEKPQFCNVVQSIFTVTGVQRSVLRAGGNGRYGRRDFTWHGGGNAVLRYEKRNVLGFSMDFAEDWSKSNWSIETTWIEDLPQANNDSFDGLEEVDQYNLTISADRPTFISFLNANRTFFINTQWFFQYTSNYDDGFTSNGPFNAFFTLAIQTGYFQDRLLPSLTTVFDFGSASGAVLPQVTYRFTERFSATFGMNVFFGEEARKDAPVNPLALPNRSIEDMDDTFVENGLSPVREKDEIFARIRYTF